MTDYFKSTQSPNAKDVYKTLADVLADITIVDLLSDSTLDVDGVELNYIDSINTAITLSAMNALLRNEVIPLRTSTPKHNKPETSTPPTVPKKKLKMNTVAARDKLIYMRDSDISSLDTESDSQLLISSQE